MILVRFLNIGRRAVHRDRGVLEMIVTEQGAETDDQRGSGGRRFGSHQPTVGVAIEDVKGEISGRRGI